MQINHFTCAIKQNNDRIKNSISSNKTTFVPVAVKRFKKEKCCAGYPRNFCPNTTDYFKEASFVIRARSKYVVDLKGLGMGSA
jgi:hypothetical protein